MNKPGLKTTEAWISFVIIAIGLLMASGLLADGSKEMRAAGLATALLKALMYTWSRTHVKTAGEIVDDEEFDDNTPQGGAA